MPRMIIQSAAAAWIEPTTPFTEAELLAIEQAVGRILPEKYKKFVCAYGGAFVGGAIDGNAELPVLSFLDADAVRSTLEILSDLKDDGVLPVAGCELGNLYVIDRENAVHYLNYYGGKTRARKVADEFGDFLNRIVVEAEDPEKIDRG